MKRFYCAVCNKVKRVRKYPQSVTTPNAPKVEDRRGVCKWHDVSEVADKWSELNRKVKAS